PVPAARASSSASSRRPTPSPRVAGDTHMRLMYGGAPQSSLIAPQPTGSPCSVASSIAPAGGRNAAASAGRLRAGSKPAEKRASAGSGQARRAHAAVACTGLQLDQPVSLQTAEQPAQVARVQVQPGAQVAHVAAVADLPQQATLAQRPVARQVGVVERADPLR